MSSSSPPCVGKRFLKFFFPPCEGSVSAMRRYFRDGNVEGEARSGTGNKGAWSSRPCRRRAWLVIDELATPIERNGTCRRMSLPEERARCQAAPSFRRRSRRWGMQRRHCRKNGTAAARHPYLEERARSRRADLMRRGQKGRSSRPPYWANSLDKCTVWF